VKGRHDLADDETRDQPGDQRCSKRDGEQGDPRRRHRLRRHARRVDDAELRAACILHALADRCGLSTLEQRLVGPLLDVVVAADLRVLGFDKVKLYDGAWAEWGAERNAAKFPVEPLAVGNDPHPAPAAVYRDGGPTMKRTDM